MGNCHRHFGIYHVLGRQRNNRLRRQAKQKVNLTTGKINTFFGVCGAIILFAAVVISVSGMARVLRGHPLLPTPPDFSQDGTSKVQASLTSSPPAPQQQHCLHNQSISDMTFDGTNATSGTTFVMDGSCDATLKNLRVINPPTTVLSGRNSSGMTVDGVEVQGGRQYPSPSPAKPTKNK
jgi:hypothetical protein